MRTYDRRTFVRRSAVLAATAAAACALPPHVDASAPTPTGCKENRTCASESGRRPEVIAHRGGNGQWPGETMRAFREAAKLKVDVLEMDVYLSADGELMLMHDPEVEKTTEGEGYINRLHSGYLQGLNAGHKWSPDGECCPFKDKKVLSPEFADLKVPRLEEVFREFPDARMVIEMKKADKSPAVALSELIDKHHMKDKVLVASFVGDFMNEFRGLERARGVATSYSLSLKDVVKILKRLHSGRKLSDDDQSDPSVIEVPYQFVTEDVVRLSKKRNIKVHAWTVNDPDKMYLMWNRGVDGIITDYPGPLLALLGRAPTQQT
ncbi:MAG TPA: glycerophosphodiester phosphodiesterase family protein [Pyrinomonadaceae bacterium]|jgi:glycerophosphoryl diester phosphodiesterase|nr:glycerophosphodiester phosphodiesterase family protein [Pyrinomonadaceae bacterium]